MNDKATPTEHEALFELTAALAEAVDYNGAAYETKQRQRTYDRKPLIDRVRS